MTPDMRQLYEKARKRYPDIYEQLRDIDSNLAALHHAGLDLQRQRLHLLQTVSSDDRLSALTLLWP